MLRLKLAVFASLFLLTTSPVSAQPAQMIIQVWSFGFAPNPVHLAAGRPVILTFVNLSTSSHDFSAPGFFEHASFAAGSVPLKEIELKPHETKSVTLTPAAGSYEAHCSHFMHKQMGMSDVILVN